MPWYIIGLTDIIRYNSNKVSNSLKLTSQQHKQTTNKYTSEITLMDKVIFFEK